MKTLVGKLSVFAVLLGMLDGGVAKAQIANELDFQAPAGFIAGETKLPAGSYSLRPFSTEDPSLLELTNAAGNSAVLLSTEFTESETPAKETQITFNKYGSELVLKTIQLQGQQSGYWMDAGYREKTLAKSGKPTKQSVPATAR